VEKQEPRARAIRPKLRYAHQGGMNPPVIVIHGNALDAVGEPTSVSGKAFPRYFQLVGTPLRIELRTGKNPFAPDGSEIRHF
jgi:GTP-binding protein